MPVRKCECKILVVDDDKAVGKLVSEMIKADGYKVSFALSGAEAIVCVKNTDYDLVLVDYVMPLLNGLETIKAIKKLKPKTKTILISGVNRDTEEGVGESLKNGLIDEFLQKPFFRTALQDSLKKHIGV